VVLRVSERPGWAHGVLLDRSMRLVALLLSLVAACSSDPNIDLDSYDRRCTVATDCVLVTGGDACICDCGNGAINKADLTHYEDDFAAARATCSSVPTQCFCEAPAAPICSRGTCVLP
jgi:hypothetical protein